MLKTPITTGIVYKKMFEQDFTDVKDKQD